MLINITHHPHTNWQPQQLAAAQAYGNIIDVPFPNIPPEATTDEVETLAEGLINEVRKLIRRYQSPPTVHFMGEMTFTYILLTMLYKADIPCVASTTQRIVTMEGETKKTTFKFIQFRPYF